MGTNLLTGVEVERLRELIEIAQARAGWCDEWNTELNVLACRVGPALFRVLDAARAMATVCTYPCGDLRKCGNCNALREALEAPGL